MAQRFERIRKAYVTAQGRIAAGLSDPSARWEIDEATEQEVSRQRVDAQHRHLQDVGRRIDRKHRSRGRLVADFLDSPVSPQSYLEQVDP